MAVPRCQALPSTTVGQSRLCTAPPLAVILRRKGSEAAEAPKNLARWARTEILRALQALRMTGLKAGTQNDGAEEGNPNCNCPRDRGRGPLDGTARRLGRRLRHPTRLVAKGPRSA